MESTKHPIDIDSLLDTFDLVATESNIVLDNWLKVSGTLNAEDQRLMNILLHRIKTFGDYWNEEELKINFIGLLFLLADIDEDGKIKTFFERSIAATVQNVPLTVKSDCMIATPKGKGSPKAPYFFLQEYKKQKGDNRATNRNDPEGQMLAAMLIAQNLNNDQRPIYGTWLVGSIWWFSVLVDNEYTKSRKYDASQESDLLQIILTLRKLKSLILELPKF